MNDLVFDLAHHDDIPEIMRLYKSLISMTGDSWNLHYPNAEIAKRDIDNNSLYILKKNEVIIAAASVGGSEELKHLPWNPQNPCELSRVSVKPEFQRQGIGSLLLYHTIRIAQEKGFDGICMLVSKTNPAALALYEKHGFEQCGETFMYDKDFYCYQMTF